MAAGARRGPVCLGRLTPETIRGLYGDRLQLRPLQADRAASCRFAYFMQYGLRARERKEITVDPAEFGTFVHDVLEHTARDVCRAGGFSRVSLERTQAMAEEHARRYCGALFRPGTDQPSGLFLLERNMRSFRRWSGSCGRSWRSPGSNRRALRSGSPRRRHARGGNSGGAMPAQFGLCGPAGPVPAGWGNLCPGGGLQNRPEGF